jgi:integrase/recombinase XerD
MESCKLEAEVRGFLADLGSKPSYSESTRVAYRNDLRIFFDHLSSVLGRSPTIDDFNKERALEFLNAEFRNGRKANTLLRRRASLQRFEKYLLDTGILPESRISGLFSQENQTQLKDLFPKENPIFLSDDQLEKLLACLGEAQRPLVQRDQALFSLLLETGLSTSSLTGINLPDLDLNVKKIHIKLSRGNDCWLPIVNAAESIEQYLQYGRPELNPDPEELALFISQNGVRMSRQSVWQVFRQWGRTAGLSEPLSPRMLRHTAAQHMVRAGRPLIEIQALLGHTNSLSTYALLHRLASGEASA